MLDPEVRRDLRSLAKDTAELVARHLVCTGRLIDEDPQAALTHARAASALAGRVAAVREAAGLAAYAAGEWREAMSELRTARRLSGSPEHLPVLADCERGLGRPERALALLDDPEAARLEPAARVELLIVASGARRDLEQSGAAVLVLRDAARRTTAQQPWATRLWYAYGDALEADQRESEAAEWFERAAEADDAGQTDADERLLALQGVSFPDDLEGDQEPDQHPDQQQDQVRDQAASTDEQAQMAGEADQEVEALLAQVTERSRRRRDAVGAEPDGPVQDDGRPARHATACASGPVSQGEQERSAAPGVLFQAPAATGQSAQPDDPGADVLF